MIRTTYKGRAIKALAVRGKPHQRKLVINGHTINHGWEGTDEQAIAWFQQVIDRIDQAGGPGTAPGILRTGQYTSPHWFEPGTYDINPAGHATAPGGLCLCTQCVIPDPCGDKARHAPLPPNACRHCHQTPDNHRNDYDLMHTHRYTEPTEVQRAGRQAAVDKARQLNDEDDDEATCDAIYPDKVRGYLSQPSCLYLADHRDASDPNFHYDHRGFRWRRQAAA